MEEKEDWSDYLPEKERNAVREIDIREYPGESTATRILRCLNLKKANSIKGFGTLKIHDGY